MNRFNGFTAVAIRKTVKTVSSLMGRSGTGLKPGENENEDF